MWFDNKRLGLQNSHLFRDGGDDIKGLINFPAGVLAGHDGANAGFTVGDGGKGDAGGHDAGVEEGAGEVHGAAAVADDDWCDGGFAFWSGVAANVEAGVGELLLEVVGV